MSGVELHPWRIRVISIQPGAIRTRIWSKAQSLATRLRESYPPEAFQLYGPLFEMMERRLSRPHGTPPDSVATVVHTALTTANPKARYLVGRDARIRRWIERLPTPLRDRLILSQLPKFGESR